MKFVELLIQMVWIFYVQDFDENNHGEVEIFQFLIDGNNTIWNLIVGIIRIDVVTVLCIYR